MYGEVENALTKCFHSCWYFLHSTSLMVHTFEEREGMMQILQGLSKCLPCESCRVHLHNFLLSHERDEDVDMDAFILRLHNEVNRRQGKPTWGMDQVRKKYAGTMEGAACGPPSRKMNRKSMNRIAFVFLVAVFVGGILLLCLRTCSQQQCGMV